MKVLVVDDAEDVRFTLSLIIASMGHTVDQAEDGEMAWSLLQENSYHVIISDWMMPNVSGPELCQKIRKKSFKNYVYIILLTGMSEAESLVTGLDAGADDFAKKPYTSAEIRVRLNSAQRVIDLEASLERKRKGLESTYQKLRSAHDVINKDLQHASILQKSILPKSYDLPGSKVGWFFSPAVHVGGDTLNYHVLNSGLFFFYSIDVSGHGVSSALMSMSLHTMLNIQLKQYEIEFESVKSKRNIPLEITNNLNKEFTKKGDTDHYFTMFCGVYDANNKKIYYVQAGHPFPIIYRKSHNKPELIECSGFPVGLIGDAEYEIEDIFVEKGDRFLVYSDGVLEIKENDEKLTDDWLKNSLEKVKSLGLKDSVNYIDEKISSLIDDREQPDDVSLMLFEFS